VLRRTVPQSADLVGDAVETAIGQRAQVFGIECFGERREAAQVDRDHGHPAPFLARRIDARLRSRRLVQHDHWSKRQRVAAVRTREHERLARGIVQSERLGQSADGARVRRSANPPLEI
jgi:hypothetical protein